MMKKANITNSIDSFEDAIKESSRKKYLLRLYVTGTTPQSVKAITNIKRICETYLKGRYKLEIVDIYQQPKLAESDQIIAVPTLIKKHPLPLKKLIGDMSDKEHVLIGLDLKIKK